MSMVAHRRLALSLLLAVTSVLIPVASAHPVQAGGSGGGPPIAANTYDRMFIDMMVPHHEGAAAMAQIALVRGQHSEIKMMAQSIITDQQGEIQTMRQWRQAWFGSSQTPDMMHMPPLPGLTMSMNVMGDISYLKTETQVPFDKAFMNAMIPHHQMAIAAAKLELRYGYHAQLKALAVSIIASQAREVGIMQTYLHVWYGAPPPM